MIVNRISTADQNADLAAQERDLKGAGCTRLFSEQVNSLVRVPGNAPTRCPKTLDAYGRPRAGRGYDAPRPAAVGGGLSRGSAVCNLAALARQNSWIACLSSPWPWRASGAPTLSETAPAWWMLGRLSGFRATLRDNRFAVGRPETSGAARLLASPLAARPTWLSQAFRALFRSRAECRPSRGRSCCSSFRLHEPLHRRLHPLDPPLS